MIGFVVVSHSARLAEGICELAAQVGQDRVRLAAAGGTGDLQNPIGTDAFRVLAAIESIYSEDGVLVLMDLGSAVLSAETALELLDEAKRRHVHLYPGPIVEQTVAAVSLAAAGAGVDEIRHGRHQDVEGESASTVVTVQDKLGLHARPAAQFIRRARRFRARVSVENVTIRKGPVDAGSINGLLGLDARQGHSLRIDARGPESALAVEELAKLVSGLPDIDRQTTPPEQLRGIAASGGIAIGPLIKLQARASTVESRTVEDPPAEERRLQAAVKRAAQETKALFDWATAHTGAAEAGIFDAQLLFLEDPQLVGRASRIIQEEKRNAESAWQQAAAEIPEHMRAADVADVAMRVLRALTHSSVAMPELAEPSILAAHDLTPSEVRQLDPGMTLGLCLATGSASAHSVILARAMGIPAVAGLGPALAGVADGTIVALDGEHGTIAIAPSPEDVELFEARRSKWLDTRKAAQAERHKPAATRDGRPIRVLANISSVEEAAMALDFGAEGVGVLRTEFLFLGRREPPDEEEQVAAYRAIADVLGSRPLVIRTLDVGGDKDLPYIEIGEEENPFLGWRGIRLTLGRPDLLRTQLRAIHRAAAGHRVEILLPMISSLDELRAARALLAEIGCDLPLGVMIEVPSAVAIADQLAREACSFSIGTNDLVQYVMAADRTNARVAAIADPLQPAVLRVIRQVVEAGRGAGIPVTLCGELAADPLVTPLLLGLGLDEFSVSPPLIPALKRALSRWSSTEARSIAERSLSEISCAGVRQFLVSL